MEKKNNNTGENYLGLMGFADKHKKQLFEILYLCRLWEEYLVCIKDLKFKRENLALVGGMIAKVNSDIQFACTVSSVLLYQSSEEQVEFFENIDLEKLSKAVNEMRNLVGKIPNYNKASWWLKMVVWIRYGDWKRILFQIVYGFFFLFVFGAVLYFFIANDFGRDLAWKFLDIYGVAVKFLMIFLLILATIVIVASVSFMYFESKNKKKTN